jgi:monoterpene epsilon-lactone hydrolase
LADFPPSSGVRIVLRASVYLAVALVIALSAFLAGKGMRMGTASIDSNGTVTIPSLQIPLSALASAEAGRSFVEAFQNPQGFEADIGRWREKMDRDIFIPALERRKKEFAVRIEERSIGGVKCAVVAPATVTGPDDRILIELHGGAFVIGGLTAGVAEAIPIAALSGIKVVAVDYRQGPEFKFPAASQDVVAVYRELLKQYKPERIGIFGTSAGGMLTAEAVAWLKKEGLPRPGALGIFASGAGGWNDGDSSYWAAPITGKAPLSATTNPGHRIVSDSPYFSEADLRDPLVAPVWSQEYLSYFPPTLLISGTRSFDLSSVVFTHAQMVKAGVDAELHVWEGMSHAFTAGGQPESTEALAVEALFFQKHLPKQGE